MKQKTLDDVALSLPESVSESRSEPVMHIYELHKQGKLTKTDEDAVIRLALRIVDRRRYASMLGLKPEEYTPDKIWEIIQELEAKQKKKK
jgi:hypothetical protein